MASKARRPGKPGKGQKISGVGAIYARYSSRAQRDVSIEQQVRECTDYAQRIGITITETYADRAISGKSDKRPNFQRMLNDAEAGKFDYLLAWKSNRIGRNMMEAMMNEVRLSDCGIRVLYVEEDFEDNAAGRFALRNMMNVNQFYSENLAEDVARGMRDNAEKCMVNHGLPYGYKSVDKKYAIDEPRAEIVREIFTRVADGDAYADIALELNRRGITTGRGKPWNKNSFHVMLKNERYKGVYIYDDIRIDGGIPRIISDELFGRVQEALKVRKTKRHGNCDDYLLTGKIFCGYCGSPITGISGTSKQGTVHHYYACNKRRYEHACKKRNVRRDVLEKQVANAIKTFILNDETMEWMADATMKYAKSQRESSCAALLESDLATVQVSIKNIMAAIEQGIITASTKKRLLELEEKQSALEEQLEFEKSKIMDVSREQVLAWLKTFQQYDIDDPNVRANLFKTFISAIYLYDDHFRIVFNYSGDNSEIDLPLIDAIGQSNNPAGCSFSLSKGVPSEQGISLARFVVRRQKFFANGLNFSEGTPTVGHATGMSFVWLLLAYQKKQGRTLASFSFVLILCGERSITKGSENMDGNETEALLRAILELIEKCETLEELRASVKRIMGE